jgi:5-methylcytosine-specific restriction endonuclease McrA
MSVVQQKIRPIRMAPPNYDKLRQQVLRRDGWRCQSCGAMSNLEVHHQEFRSHSGADSEGNLITLCAACHARIHSPHNAMICSGLSFLSCALQFLLAQCL